MPKPTSVADPTPVRVAIISLDNHMAGAVERARPGLQKEIPGLELSFHAASDWNNNTAALERCRERIARADIIVVTMLFMEEHIEPVLEDLRARHGDCDALVAIMSSGEVMKLTQMGKFTMDGSSRGPMSWLKKLRGQGKSKKGKEQDDDSTSGEKQAAMLRRIPRLLRFIPGTAQDVRAYFLTWLYFLASSDENVANMVRFLINRYADGPRRGLRGSLTVQDPIEYPDVGVYHPRIAGRVSAEARDLPAPEGGGERGTVGLLLMRSYVLAGDSAHYDGVISALESRGYRVIPAFASGLDNRPAVERYFMADGRAVVDAVVSLTSFSLVGGPAYNNAGAAEQLLRRLDVPYLIAQALEFQSLEQWEASDRGLTPVETTMMVAIPELDGATNPMVFAGRAAVPGSDGVCRMEAHPERAGTLAGRVDRLVQLRRSERSERKLSIVIFSFPPQAGALGTAAYLSVFASLYNTLAELREAGYRVELPESAEALRDRIIAGNANQYGAHANVHARISVDDYVSREPYLQEIEAQWGSAPGRQQSDGQSIFVLGEQFGNVFVGVQPGFGYEGDPMRLLFEKGLTPTHAMSAFYRYIREDFGADAVLHFGTHGALEFMPGKQCGMSGHCWPDRLIGDLPNYYLYAANNPSEGSIAKRRSAATLISYLTPPVGKAGLYKGLLELKSSVERYRGAPPDNVEERAELARLIQSQAAAVDLAEMDPEWGEEEAPERIAQLSEDILEMEYTLIPEGLHVVGQAPSREGRIDQLVSIAETVHGVEADRGCIAALVDGHSPQEALAAAESEAHETTEALLEGLAETARQLGENRELEGIVQALDGRFVPPVAGGDLLRSPQILPTGRNMHGFDPYRIPSAFAVQDGAKQAERLLDKHREEGQELPDSIAMVLWGTDNLKSEGGPIGQALHLIGARPRFDSYGKLAGAELIPLEELGRKRIDLVITLSGIFRDLLPLQTRVLAEAAYLAAEAEDEPLAMNPIRRNALAYQEAHGCDFETAALRVFSNADGAYGSNVGSMIDQGAWEDEDELADTYTRRKCYAYGRTGQPVRQEELLGSMLSGVELTYQNLESVELGVTTIDHYFDTLGGISRAVGRARGDQVPVYIGDQTRGEGKVRTLSDQVALETRTRMLNPKWYESLLEHGYEGVHQIEEHLTNTMGWSATTGQVSPWVYQQFTQTFMLDEQMRERMAQLNPAASAKLAHRLLEAHERNYWNPDEETLEALRRAGDELEDYYEGVTDDQQEAAA
ncbi:magnesium chelatase subunit H [Halorhodospira neutriphila]|uniref:magnesium chelatase n=1 Tax=Halorhodospira neutriphila TaxID=168379 RepID=A0ABS1E5E4_9GAMM|nr:magnesium chelatase subunit H [Halorhodospira neutriphila]MBK1726322.1 magnesium chelatase subunit H [Halorhodospira neutriphila]